MTDTFRRNFTRFGAYYFVLEGDTIHCGRWEKLLFSCSPQELGERLLPYLRVDEARTRQAPAPAQKIKITLTLPSQLKKGTD